MVLFVGLFVKQLVKYRNRVILCNVTKGSSVPDARPAVAMQLLETQLKLK